ncbi:hypothetical protein CC205_05730 [Pseudomonas savastanoi pv. nerii]|uniref:Lipoprotein n=1 Tax=Pseudomonas savastanoi pv. nerii TaxID=360921 RepID=A0AB73QCW1_PSESS|nr:hypothetical protein [Pseudomonas savastanoi]PAB37567.1 hypothetical protein CC205_05730 [Pseudomonas savastanoi pv. nerii]
MNKTLYAALLGCSLLVMAGCDQIESSTKHVVNAAADTAKQAIDEAKQEFSVQQPPQSSAETENTTDK